MPTTFDLITNPQLIRPAYGFYAAFLGAGVVLAIVTILAIRFHWRQRKFLCVFTPVWIVGVAILLFLDARDIFRVRGMVQRGQYTTVEGCLGAFHPGSPYGSKTTAGNERWSIADREFDYGQGEGSPYYHVVEARGGLVHSNSRLRVSYVISPYYGTEKIIRLQAVSPPCPATSDKG